MTSGSAGNPQTGMTAKARWLKTTWHPTQIKALTILTERVASPKEIAAEIKEPVVGNVSYHVKELEKRSLVEPVGTKQRRGATEHFYKATVRPAFATEEWDQADREAATKLAFQLFFQDVAVATEAGTFDSHPERHLSRIPLYLDQQGFLDLVANQDGMIERALEIQAESDARRLESGEEGCRVSSLMATFTMPPGRSPLDRSTQPRSKIDD